MPVARRLASRLLNAVVRHSSPDSRYWGDAMLRELDFVESDWGAFFWALGSTTALVRHSAPGQLRRRLEKGVGPARRLTLKNVGLTTVGMLAGMVIAGSVLIACVESCVRLVSMVFPAGQLGHAPFVERLTVMVVPAAAFIVTAVALWRKQRPMATGILLAAITFVAHVILHVAGHG
jgi:hypothetical protein